MTPSAPRGRSVAWEDDALKTIAPAVLVLTLLSCGGESVPTRPDRTFGEIDRTRFVALAIFEGLLEEWPAKDAFEAILNDPRAHFVDKCQICGPVKDGLRWYLAISENLVSSRLGGGFPDELRDGLRSPDRAARLKALESMVDRYLSRRFERQVLTPGERSALQSLLDGARKFGMTIKNPAFGETCPSCSGATRFLAK